MKPLQAILRFAVSCENALWNKLLHDDAIKQFAGPDFEKARYYREDDEYLLERELTVDHYEVVRNSKT